MLREALSSVIPQLNRHDEVIVVDDGSTANILAVIPDSECQVRCVRQSNAGPAEARNRGLLDARGDYIAFLDSDDLWFPWTLDVFRTVLSVTSSPSFLAGRVQESPVAERHGKTPQRQDLVYSLSQDYLYGNPSSQTIFPSAVAVRADVLRQVGGFAPGHVNAEDHDLWLRLGTAHGFLWIDTPVLARYRRHDASEGGLLHLTFMGMRRLLDRERAGEYPGGLSRAKERRAIITAHVRPAALAALRDRQRLVGWELYRRTFCWHVVQLRLKFLFAWPLLWLKSLCVRQRI